LTGGSGTLGRNILKSGYFENIISPGHETLDITDKDAIMAYFAENEIDALIHCAAIARMRDCAEEPTKAIQTNIIGTSNLVMAVLKKEQKSKKIRFIHISSDGVYSGTEGNFSEKDATIPYNKYGWTKLGAETAVNLLSNFCIIRTGFFEPENIKWDDSATDAYSSKITVQHLVKAIAQMLENNFVGTINIGSERKSDYERYKEHKPSLKTCKFEDIQKAVPFQMARDASMDVTLWEKIRKGVE